MAATAAVAELSGWNLRSLVERPSDPIAPLVVLLTPTERVELGIIDPPSDSPDSAPALPYPREATSTRDDLQDVVIAPMSRLFLPVSLDLNNLSDSPIAVTVGDYDEAIPPEAVPIRAENRVRAQEIQVSGGGLVVATTYGYEDLWATFIPQ